MDPHVQEAARRQKQRRRGGEKTVNARRHDTPSRRSGLCATAFFGKSWLLGTQTVEGKTVVWEVLKLVRAARGLEGRGGHRQPPAATAGCLTTAAAVARDVSYRRAAPHRAAAAGGGRSRPSKKEPAGSKPQGPSMTRGGYGGWGGVLAFRAVFGAMSSAGLVSKVVVRLTAKACVV